jgi:hypothetical protein
MSDPCMPAPPPNPFADVTDPCALAAQMQAALMQLLSGATPSAIVFGDQSIHFSRANIPELRKEISRLSAMCDASHGRHRTVRAGPHARWTAPGFGFGGY